MTDFSRISGLASGFDTESIIQDLMSVHRMPVNRLMQERQVLEWQREDYRDINKSILAFRNNYSFNMRLQSTFLTKTAASTNESVVTASASSNTQNATYNITVTELAKTAYNNSSASISSDPGNKIDAGAAMWTQMDRFASWETVSVNGETTAVTLETAGAEFYFDNKYIQNVTSITVNSVSYEVHYDQAAFDGSTETNKVLVDKLTGRLTFAEEITDGSVIEANYSYYENTFSITTYDQEGSEISKEFSIDFANDSLNDLLAAISSDKSLGLTAYYDELSDKVSITTTRTGDNNPNGAEINAGTSGFLYTTLNINQANELGGTDAVLTINGLEITRKSNDFTLNNVDFSLKGTGEATISVKGDTDGVVQTITEYIEQYNKVLQKINDKLTEEYYRDYPPLTDEQREQLTDRQIEQWEERSRSGLLRNDFLLSGIVTELHQAMSGRVSGLSTYDSLASIGITTKNYQERGILHIDEDKLRSALENDPDAVMNLFTANGTGDTAGIAMRVDNCLKSAMDKLTKKAGNPDSLLYDNSTTSRSIREIEERITAMENRLVLIEDRYWKQFTAMEQAISRMNTQSYWLEQQIMYFAG